MKNVAIITGASSGIGRQFALTLSGHGSYDEVWAIARNRERLETLKNELPFPVRTFPMDLTEEKSFDLYKELLENETPNVRLLMNCSGFGVFEATENVPLRDTLGMIDLNCRALTALTCLTLPYMRAGAEIVEIASVAAFQPIPYINVYGATKAYVLSFSRALNRELRPRGIRVLAVCPYWTKTRFFDRAVSEGKEPIVKKYTAMYDPSDITSAAWKALKRKRKDYVVPGFKARLQVRAVKLLPHSLVMNVWQTQQKLK